MGVGRGATIWPGALREGLGQPDLGLLADLAMARSVSVTLSGILLISPSMNAVFCLHSGPRKIETGWCDVTNGVESSVTNIPP